MALKFPASIPHAHSLGHLEAILSDFTVWDNVVLWECRDMYVEWVFLNKTTAL